MFGKTITQLQVPKKYNYHLLYATEKSIYIFVNADHF